MAPVDSRDYVLGGIYYSVLERRRCVKHNVACQHSQHTRDETQLQTSPGSTPCVCWAAFNSSWSGSAYCWWRLQADTHPMSAKCWASIAGAGQFPFSPSQYFMLAGAHAHSAWRAAADSEMEVSAYFTSVHIPSFGRAVTGTAADSEMEVSDFFTSVLIPSFGRAVTCRPEMNGTHRLTEHHRQHWADKGKATCPHLCVQRGRYNII